MLKCRSSRWFFRSFIMGILFSFSLLSAIECPQLTGVYRCPSSDLMGTDSETETLIYQGTTNGVRKYSINHLGKEHLYEVGKFYVGPSLEPMGSFMEKVACNNSKLVISTGVNGFFFSKDIFSLNKNGNLVEDIVVNELDGRISHYSLECTRLK